MKKRTKKVAVISCKGGSPLKPGVDSSVYANDCAAILAAHSAGIYDCSYACLGGGSCVASCKFDAITIGENHIARIKRESCTGCGLCVKACPQNIIRLALTENVILVKCSNKEPGAVARKNCANSCIACRICEKNCPADAIHVIDNCSIIDQERCIACGMCAVKCPRGVLADVDGVLS